MGKRMNDMVTKDSDAIIPLIYRGTASAHANSLGGVQSTPGIPSCGTWPTGIA